MNNIYNIKKSRLFAFILAIAIIAVGAFTLSACNNDSVGAGIYFRRLHGFIGVAHFGGGITLMAFNIGNQDIDFLEDSDNLSFGIDGVNITNAEIRLIHAISHNGNPTNSEYFILDLAIEMQVGTAQITHLKTSEGAFEIGSINLRQEYRTDAITSHAMLGNAVSDDGIYFFLLTLGEANTQSFEIKELIFNHDKIYSYDLEDIVFPISYVAGTRLEFPIWLTFDKNRFDQFVLNPILRIVLEGQEEYSFFIPLMATMHGAGMTYLDIKEYILNL